MFQEKYREAYDNICPGKDSVNKILQEAARRMDAGEALANKRFEKQKKIFGMLRPVAVAILAACLLSTFMPPVAAKYFGNVYEIIEKYVPSLAEFMLPEEIVSTNHGITMQVEAIDIVDKTAEILLSFRDAEDSEKDVIRGKVDLDDSVRLQNFGEDWSAGGASFLEYDEMEDKAYYKVELFSSDAYSRSRVRLGVTQLLTEFTEEERVIDMTDLLTDPVEKIVTLSGVGGMREREAFPFFEKTSNAEDPRPVCRVMDIAELEESLLEDLKITGVAYDEGVLRVQSCRGNLAEADRHVRVYLKDADGNERINDGSVGWQEEINGERVLFDEQWFLISEAELENYNLYGMFFITDGAIKGNWEVTFRLD